MQVVFELHVVQFSMRSLQGTQAPACTVKAGTEQEVQTTVEEQVAQLAMVAQLWQVVSLSLFQLRMRKILMIWVCFTL